MCMHNSHARTIPLQTRGPAGPHYPHARTLLLALPAYNSLHVPVPCRELDISPRHSLKHVGPSIVGGCWRRLRRPREETVVHLE